MVRSNKRQASLKRIPLALLAGAALLAGLGAAAAEDATEDQIVRALAPKRVTRSLSAQQPAANPAEAKFVDSLRNRRTRSLSSGEREQIATIAKDRPNIDLEISFEYNSADISAKAQPAVAALGKALSNPDLKGSTFVVAGHTDAVGGETYNMDLSERRAEAIKKVLVDRYGINSSDLVTVGYGKSKPKDTAKPMDPANRRVQVVNMATQATAAK
jgi:outer membrane protein OmpA-like peptidoglycan-associated protein